MSEAPGDTHAARDVARGTPDGERRTGRGLQPTDQDEKLRRTRAAQYRYASLGLEFGAGIAGFVLLGWWLDSVFKTSPGWLIGCASAGFVGGMYHLIRRGMEMQREFERPDSPSPPARDDDAQPPSQP